MVDATILLRRMATIRHSLARLESKQRLSRADFLTDEDAQDVVLRHLQVGVQGALTPVAKNGLERFSKGIPGASRPADKQAGARHQR